MSRSTFVRVLAVVMTLSLLAGGVALAGVGNSRHLAQALTNRQAVYVTSGVSATDLSNGSTADQLAQSLAGPGVSVSNVTYTGNNRAAGSFNNGLDSIGFGSGVVLSSGNVQSYPSDSACSRGVEGPNNCYEAQGGQSGGPDGGSNSTAFGTAGDPDLDALIGGSGSTEDAAVLEFDFVPKVSTTQINYVFGSEEYSDFVGSIDDVFGFFVNGQNCALVPGTGQPVSVNTINNGSDAGGSATPSNPQLFRDNVRPSPSIDSQMDGLTTVLTCTASVNPGQTNTMKLAVADASDNILDSAVFIQTASLTSGMKATGGQSFAGTAPFTINGNVATFSDTTPGTTAGSYSATIDWGDGSAPTAGTIGGSDGSFTVAGSHTYTSGGSFNVTVTIVETADPSNTASAADVANIGGGGGGGSGGGGTKAKPSLSSSAPPVVQGTSGAAFDDAVSPNGLPTTAFYQYGLDARYRGHATTGIVYDQSTPPQSVGSDFTAHQIHASVSGLVPNALYHFRLVANNSSGTVFGPDQTFTTAKDVAPPAPVLGKVVNVKPVSGVVFIKPPKGKSLGKLSHARGLAAVVKGTGFLPLTEARQIPSGSQIDARQGSLQVTAAPAGKSGKTQVGTFGGGIFKLAQDRRKTTKGLTTMSLLEGDFPGAPSYVSCGAKAHTTSGGSPAQAARKRRKLSSKVLQTLRSSVKGNFRTRGRYSAATVRGTAWDMSDRCDGTLTVVHKGTVDVLDSVLHKTVRVHAGHRYLASAVKPPKAKPKRKHK